MTKRIAFQGELGAYSHEACAKAQPDFDPLPCRTFEEVIDAVREGRAELAMLPIENTTYGRVADIHRLLPDSGLHIIGETFVRVRIALMANPGVALEDIAEVHAHLVLLPQSASFLKAHKIKGIAAADSAGAAAELAASGSKDWGVLASEMAAETHGLNVLATDIEDHGHNTTRFVIMAPEAQFPPRVDTETEMMTTFIFQVRNIPAALYKAMGGFATNGVNMTKLESYMVGGSFTATQFYSDIVGHPEDPAVQRAMEELEYFTEELKILGTYKVAESRLKG